MAIQAPIVTAVLDTPTGEHTQVTVQTTNRNQVQFDLLRNRKGWPAQKDAPMLWLTVITWHALAVAGHLPPDQTFEAFNDTCLELYVSDEDGTRKSADQLRAERGIDPSQPVPDTGY